MATQTGARTPALGGIWGESIAEFFGTMILILFGDGCVACFGLFKSLGFTFTWPVIIFGWGFAVMLGIYVAGAISGAHINPAVTVALAATRRFPWGKVPYYIVAQVLGAFVAGGILYFVYFDALYNALSLAHSSDFVNNVGYIFFTFPKGFVTYFNAFWDEFLGTALLVGLILAIVDGRNQPVQGNLNPLIIGFLIVAIGASFGLNSGYAINPARDFGPRLWVGFVTGFASFGSGYWWIPIVAPLLGGTVGAFIYDYTIGKVLAAKGLMKSGAAETIGEAVRGPTE
jgi:glycerol uptake facilitator protein